MCKRALYFVMILACVGVAGGAPLAPDHGSLEENLCLWLRMPEVNYDPGTATWTDLSGKGNDASATVDGFQGPTLSSGENATVFARPFSALHCDPTVQELLKATNLNGGQGLTHLTIFSVQKLVDPGSVDQRAVGFGSYNDGGRADHFNMSFDVTVRKDNGRIDGKSQDHPLDTFVIYVARMDPSVINMWFNSTGALSLAYTATGSSYTTSNDLFYVGDVRYPASGDFDVAEVVVFNTALTDEQIEGVSQWLQAYVGVKAKTAASGPNPIDGATDVPRDTTLSWTPVATAVQRDVYFGTEFDDVNTADAANPTDLLVSQGQTGQTYDPGRLEFGQTYYWRIDEANGAPDNTVFKGAVWTFTVEPVGYPVEGITATSSGIDEQGEGPENTVNGSGLNADDQHSLESADMWLTNPVDGEPLAIQFEFDRIHKLHQMLVWNHNSAFEPLLGFGVKDATVEYSADGVDWSVLGDVELAQATATETYTANTTIDFAGVAAQYVRLTVNTGHGTMGQFGLSEVRFLSIPVQAREPHPADGMVDVAVAGTQVSWRPGREAAAHEVNLGTDPNALALIDTTTEPTLDPGPLDLAATYHWRVDEVNDAEAIDAWPGEVWSFSTEQFIVVDDFEDYDDEENTIFDTWIDGFVNETGSTVGYFDSPFAEQTITHGGGQSMPLTYDNTNGITVSEATRTFDAPQDWSRHGIKGLLIRFFGDPDNDTAQMYVKIDDDKVLYDGDAENLARTPWQLWYVDLAGMDVSNVRDLTIGIEGSGAGMIFVDDITLSPYERQQIAPAAPDATGLVSHFAFDGNTSDSTGAHPGTPVGSPAFVEGKMGQAISLNGTGDYVDLVGYKGVLGAGPVTVAAWVKTTSTVTGAIIGWGPNVGGQRFGFRIDAGRLRHEHHGGNIQGDTVMNDGAWHHVAITVQAGATISHPEAILWLDGADDTRPTTDPDPYALTADLDVRIGSRPAADDRLFMGEIDELYIYERALSQAEIAYLAGRTQPFDVD